MTFPHRLIQFAFIGSLAIAPFYFGGDRLLAWGITGILQSFIFLALFALPKSNPIPSSKDTKLLIIGAVLCAIAFIWAIIQIIPMESPGLTHPIWVIASEALNREIPGTIAISPDEAFLTLIKVSITILTFSNARTITQNSGQPFQIILVIAVIASIYAIIGMVMIRLYPGGHFWLATSPYSESLVSTYVNRNSFAQYLGLSGLCVGAYFLYVIRKISHRHRSLFHLLKYHKDNIHIIAVFLGLFSIILTSLLLTLSRGGVFTVLVAYTVFLMGFIRMFRNGLYQAVIYVLIIMGIGYLLYESYSHGLGIRNVDLSENYETRVRFYSSIWELILTRPWTGYGLGGFEAAFRAHKSIDFGVAGGIWLRAHNVYLDTFLALGIPAGMCVVTAAFIPLFIHIRRLKQRVTTLSLFGIAIYIQLAAHSMFDFGLQTGANAVTAAALIGASLTQVRHSSSQAQ